MTAGLALGALLLACAAGPTDGGAEERRHAFETVVAATHSGIEEPRREVVADAASWARLWAEIHAPSAQAGPAPAVDFARHMLIAVAAGTRPSGGYAIEVTGVATRGETLEVSVRETCPPRGAMVTTALTHPVAVVRVPRLEQTPTFREARGDSCR